MRRNDWARIRENYCGNCAAALTGLLALFLAACSPERQQHELVQLRVGETKDVRFLLAYSSTIETSIGDPAIVAASFATQSGIRLRGLAEGTSTVSVFGTEVIVLQPGIAIPIAGDTINIPVEVVSANTSLPTDTDADGVHDVDDGCPSDANKTEPGICGCGVADIDADADGVIDCIEGSSSPTGFVTLRVKALLNGSPTIAEVFVYGTCPTDDDAICRGLTSGAPQPLFICGGLQRGRTVCVYAFGDGYSSGLILTLDDPDNLGVIDAELTMFPN